MFVLQKALLFVLKSPNRAVTFFPHSKLFDNLFTNVKEITNIVEWNNGTAGASLRKNIEVIGEFERTLQMLRLCNFIFMHANL